jgi:Type II CAAX prenyl endopeptidase Rce1-like
MAVSAVLIRPLRTARASLVRPALAFAAALGGAEAVYRVVGPLWGAVCFAAVFLAMVQLAVLVSARSAAGRKPAALLVVASLVPLDRLLVLTAPIVPSLRLYPNALWVLPMGLASVYAYRARWIPGTRPWLLRLPGSGWPPLAVQAGVAAAGAGLGVLAAYALPYAGPHVLIYADAHKWLGAVLFGLAGGVEELAWRGVLQRIAADAAGPIGVAACFVASAYVSVAWMGPSAAVPVILLSGLTSVVVYRTRCLTGAVTGHFLLNLLLVMLR